MEVKIKNALISVYYKDGLTDLCRGLLRHGISLYATQGTAAYLEKELGQPVLRVEGLTQFPEMMDGRVKTLHPRIFGGILARRDHAPDMQEAQKFEVPLFDLVVGNLYPFAEHLDEAPSAQSAFVDIGGPSLLRAAAKNHAAVVVASDPTEYAGLLHELQTHSGSTTLAFRFGAAARTFQRTSLYDGMIANQWAKQEFPSQLALQPRTPLRYGENPHQAATWTGQKNWNVLQGKELSYNNLLDTEAALRLVSEFTEPAVTIVKHNNPCGVAAGDKPLDVLFEKARDADPLSAFGGIIAVNRAIDAATAEKMSALFLEVIIAPDFSAEARVIFERKKNLRLIAWPTPSISRWDVRAALGGWLVQETDTAGYPAEVQTVTRQVVPTGAQADLRFAWLVCKHVKSNAIVIARDGVTLGIGAGQMSRVDSVGIALKKASAKGLADAVLASDAFFPFRDNIDLLRGTGIAALAQPGGSQRDAEVIQACDEHGIAMVFTGKRHFRH